MRIIILLLLYMGGSLVLAYPKHEAVFHVKGHGKWRVKNDSSIDLHLELEKSSGSTKGGSVVGLFEASLGKSNGTHLNKPGANTTSPGAAAGANGTSAKVPNAGVTTEMPTPSVSGTNGSPTKRPSVSPTTAKLKPDLVGNNGTSTNLPPLGVAGTNGTSTKRPSVSPTTAKLKPGLGGTNGTSTKLPSPGVAETNGTSTKSPSAKKRPTTTPKTGKLKPGLAGSNGTSTKTPQSGATTVKPRPGVSENIATSTKGPLTVPPTKKPSKNRAGKAGANGTSAAEGAIVNTFKKPGSSAANGSSGASPNVTSAGGMTVNPSKKPNTGGAGTNGSSVGTTTAKLPENPKTGKAGTNGTASSAPPSTNPNTGVSGTEGTSTNSVSSQGVTVKPAKKPGAVMAATNGTSTKVPGAVSAKQSRKPTTTVGPTTMPTISGAPSGPPGKPSPSVPTGASTGGSATPLAGQSGTPTTTATATATATATTASSPSLKKGGRPDTGNISFPPQGSFSEEEMDALKAHNFYREVHGSPKMNLNRKMSDAAAIYARELATQGITENSPPNQRPGQSENVDLGCSPKKEYLVSEAVKDWYNQVCYPGYQFEKDGNQEGTRNFVNMVWKDDTELGIGIAHFEMNSMSCAITVARYKSNKGLSTGKRDYLRNVNKGIFDRDQYCATQGLLSL